MKTPTCEILIEMGEGASVNRSVVKFNIKRKEIEVILQLSNDSNEISFDPFFQPLGSILLHYLIQSKQGIMIHASGVKDDEKGYVLPRFQEPENQLWQGYGKKRVLR